jgi:bacterial/archaeal transporter family-2 protein
VAHRKLLGGSVLRYAVVIAVLVGLSVATQTSFNAAAQRALGPAAFITISGLATGAVGLVITLFTARPDLTSRALMHSLASGLLGAFILGGIAFVAGQGGVARALSLVIASQLLFGLLLDALGFFGAGAEISLPKALGVGLVLAGGILVVRY